MPPEGNRVLVTGAGSGIGRALALEAASRGMRVALAGRRKAALDETAALIGARTEVLVAPTDVTDADARGRLVATIGGRWGGLDTLVNNAGVVEGASLERSDDAMLERIFGVNVVAPIALTRCCLPLLSKSSGPRIINVGSMFGDIAYPGFAAYSASKFALRGFSAALRRELAGRGVAVTYAAPRATKTPAAAAFAALIAATKMTLDPPEAVARQIWNAAERGRRSVYPQGAERVFVLVDRLFPRLVDRALAAQAAPAR